MPYQFLTQHGQLLPEHKKELQEKRGFTEETIQKYRFFSGGEYLLQCESVLSSQFSTEELIKSGVFIQSNVLNPMLLEHRVIIPYISEEKITLLRPHKLGFSDVPIQIYETFWAEKIIITEGEFKAVAAAQLGFAAIGLPGVGSFSDTHFPELIKKLNQYHVKSCYIIFDSECKDNPRFPNYKPNPNQRYDTQYFAFLMAKLIEKEGKGCFIGVLPENWRVEGKIDLDGALAQGKTREDIEMVISQSLTYRQYFEELSKEAQKVILRKTDRKYHHSHLRIEFGRYVATRGFGKREHDEEISNFVVKIIAIHDTIEGIIREVIFVNREGEHSRSFSLPAESMGNEAFRTFCLNVGNYIWKGRQEDISILWEEEFLNSDETRLIVEPDQVGWIEDEKIWVFGNVAFNTAEMRPDENGIFWMEKKGIKPVPLGITTGKNIISEGVPYLSLKDSFDREEAKLKLTETIGAMEAAKCLGWIASVPYMEEIFKAWGCFPFLFLTGKTGSGKSTVAEWLCYFLGVERTGMMLPHTTATAIQRALAYYSSLPVFLDEYRNTQKIIEKTEFLRNAYNRQAAGKSLWKNFGLRMAKVRGTLIVAGQETPIDSALLSRSIIVEILQAKRRENHFSWWTREKPKFSSFLLNVLRKKRVDDFLKVMEISKDFFTKRGIDDRTAINYSIIVAGFGIEWNGDKQFAEDMIKHVDITAESMKEESEISVFLSDLCVLKFNGALKDDFWKVEGEYLYIYFQGLYNIWAKDCQQRGVDVLKFSSMMSYFKEESGFLDGSARTRIKGQQCRCVKFFLTKISENISMLIDEEV